MMMGTVITHKKKKQESSFMADKSKRVNIYIYIYTNGIMEVMTIQRRVNIFTRNLPKIKCSMLPL